MASVGTILWRVTVLQWFVSYPLANIWRVLCSTKVGCVSRDGVSLLETRHLGRRSLGPPVAASCPVIQLLLARVQAVLAAFFPVCSFERTILGRSSSRAIHERVRLPASHRISRPRHPYLTNPVTHSKSNIGAFDLPPLWEPNSYCCSRETRNLIRSRCQPDS